METTNGNGNGNGTILDRALACELAIGRLGIRRYVRSDRVRVTTEEGTEATEQPNSEAICVSKLILACPEYAAIQAEDGRIRIWTEGRGVPSMMRRGVYLIPDGLIDTVDAELTHYQERRAAMIDAFLAVYERAAEEARATLGALYDADDYPPVARVRAAFRVTVRWVAFGVPGRMQSVSDTIYHREQARIRVEVEQAANEIRQAMRQAFADLVAHMSERLAPAPDGKPRIFRDTLVSNLREFMETFEARNIAGDGDLAALVRQARETLNGTDAPALRREPLTRSSVAAAMEGIKAKLDGMVQTRGRRFAFGPAGVDRPATAESA